MNSAAPQRSDFRFFHRLRVRWVEVDMQKIVFNGHYAMYLDTAMGDYWRELALPYEASMQALGGELYVKRLALEYHASAHYDDVLDVGLSCRRIGNSSIELVGAIFRGDQLLVSGELLYVFADPVTQTSRRVPDLLRSLLLDHAAGQAVVQIRSGDWATLGADAARVRTEVFIEEQAIPLDEEWDAADTSALHAVVYNRLDQALATGRLLVHAPGVARIGRMAVLRPMRGIGLGADVLRALMEAARRRGDREVLLHAQISARGFYERLGFQPRGEVFHEVDIPHIEMTRLL